MTYDFYEAERPWGLWTMVSSFNDRFLAQGHMYGPNLCAKYVERVGDDVKADLYTSGCPFDDVPTGLYKDMGRVDIVIPSTRSRRAWRLGGRPPEMACARADCAI